MFCFCPRDVTRCHCITQSCVTRCCILILIPNSWRVLVRKGNWRDIIATCFQIHRWQCTPKYAGTPFPRLKGKYHIKNNRKLKLKRISIYFPLKRFITWRWISSPGEIITKQRNTRMWECKVCTGTRKLIQIVARPSFHSFFFAIRTLSSFEERASILGSTSDNHPSHLKAVKNFRTWFMTEGLSLMMTKPSGRSIRSISIKRSSALHPQPSISENTVQAWRRS